jgi:hypothetical protein
MAAGLEEIKKIDFLNYHYINGYGDNGERLQYGPTAQGVEAVMPDLVLGRDEQGHAINYDAEALLMISMHALQQEDEKVVALRAEIEQLKKEKH